ncbi:MAG: DnaA regulatory inactivator Hda [Gammaproteobacteria bacterium]
MAVQLPLRFVEGRHASLALFVPGPNAELLAYLDGLGEHAAPQTLIWGATGTGKTHLLEAACRARNERGEASLYLGLRAAGELAPAVLEGLEHYALVCIDDLDAIGGRSDWELGILTLLDRVRWRGHHLLLAAAHPADGIGATLPDLASRLSACTGFSLHALNDEERLEALRRRAAARGLGLPAEVAEYLVRRCRRDMGALCTALDQLEQTALARQRRLSVRLARLVLDNLHAETQHG